MGNPLVSIIIPTRNSENVLPACLKSIKDQTYHPIELIVVDRGSTDATKKIASQFTEHVYDKEPERSAQRNFGVSKASGKYVVIIDSDMELSQEVIAQAVAVMEADPLLAGLVIPEESFGIGFWAACKSLERSFYVGVPWMEAARFFPRSLYLDLGGYDENLVSGEDWDFSQRAESKGKLGRVEAFIRHNEGNLSLRKTLGKKYYYAQKFAKYQAKNPAKDKISNQTGVLQRYGLFFANPGKLFKNPLLGLGMLYMKTAEFAYGACGLIAAKFQS